MRATVFCTRLVLVALILPILGLAGCGGDGAALVLSGRVLDDGTLEAIEGAIVAVPGGASTETDSSGFFSLSGVSGGDREVRVAASGYETATTPIPPGSGDVSLGNVFLSPAPVAGFGRITGLVTFAGLPAEGAELQAGGRRAVSKPDGTYTIYNVPAGPTTVVARGSDNLTGGSAAATVSSLATVIANVVLSTSPPPPPPLS